MRKRASQHRDKAGLDSDEYRLSSITRFQFLCNVLQMISNRELA
jgi:hypothetical protein